MLSRGRNDTKKNQPSSGTLMSRPITTRSWLMMPSTGYIHNTGNPAAGWSRGSIARWGAPRLRPNGRNLYMYDPTDPLTWDHQ